MKEVLQKFKELLLEENEKINLISRRADPNDVDRHIEDALTACKHFDFDDKKIIDVGSGAGFPGIPLAAACPRGQFTLLESELKKSQFLVMAIEVLGLKNVKIWRERAEVAGRTVGREGFDCAVARAVSELNTLAEYVLPLVKVDGVFLAWKGRNYSVELERAENALQELGGQVEDIKSYSLGGSQRYLLVIKKVKSTPNRFPRRVGVPKKRPL